MSALPPLQPLQPADPARFFTGVLADQHYQKGVQFEQQGEWERALAAYRKASTLDGHRVLFLLARGRVCQAHGLEPEAEECYRLALRLRPDDPVVLYNQAQLFAARGRLDEARANLAKIVDGDVDRLGDRAAPIFCRLGDIALRREDYAAAALYFRRALAYAPGHRYAAMTLDALERFTEFEAPFARDGFVAPKVALYGYAGAVLLGMPGDDGVDVPPYPGLGFDSLRELAQALARFVALARRGGWVYEVVAPLDEESQPLAVALAAALEAPAVPAVGQVPWGVRALGVSATGTNPPALRAGIGEILERSPAAPQYALGLREAIWEYHPAPHVVNVPIRLEFPWNRGEAAAPEHAEAYGAELARALAQIEKEMAGDLDDFTRRQWRWYGRHRRLRLDLHPAQQPIVASLSPRLTPAP
jgi:hypothetical protein